MMNAFVLLLAVSGVSLALFAHEYFCWREWDRKRRQKRAFVRSLKRANVNMRLLSLDIGFSLLPAFREASRAFNELGRVLAKVRA